jgi:hypothetical protein
MPGTDDLLREAGAAWRALVDAGTGTSAAEVQQRALRDGEVDARRRRTTLRRRVGAAAVTVAAAAVVAGFVALAHPFDQGWSGGSSASCVGPRIAVDGMPVDGALANEPTEEQVVRPGQDVQVSGRYFLTDCYDTGQKGDPPPYRTVVLTLAAGSHETRIATVHPDHDGAFTVDVTLPKDLRPGLVTLGTDVAVAQDLDLVVAAETPSPSPGPQTSSSTNR